MTAQRNDTDTAETMRPDWVRVTYSHNTNYLTRENCPPPPPPCFKPSI